MLYVLRYDHRRWVQALHLVVLHVASLVCFIILLQLQATWTFRDIVLGIMVAITHAMANFYDVTITIPGWAGPGFPNAAKPRKFDVTFSETVFMFALLVLGPGGVLPIAFACATISAIACKVWEGDEGVRNWLLNGSVNVAHRVINYTIALSWIAWLSPTGGVPFHTTLGAIGLVALIVAVPLWHAASHTLLLVVRSERSWRSAAGEMFGPNVWISMLSLAMGALGGIVSTINPLLVLSAAFPMVLSYAALIAVARQFATQAKVQALASELQVLNAGLEEKVAERTAEVARLMELRLTETSAAVHDMRHRVRSVEMTIDTLQMVLPADVQAQPLVQSVHGRLKGAIAALYTLLTEVLDAALMEGGQLEMRFQHADMRAIAREVQRQLDDRCVVQECAFAIDLPDEPLWAWCDPKRIERVIYNLCDNAVTFAVDAAETTGTEPQVCVRFTETARSIGCHVSDNGPGIAADDIARLGELGLRLHAEPTRVEGSGLGLNFCFRALNLNDGRLEIASEGPGKGSTFTAWVRAANKTILPASPPSWPRALSITSTSED